MELEHEVVTTQTAPPEDLIEIFQTVQRINSITLDLDKDMWRYISDKWLVKETGKGDVGSSTMPQKVNPINFENSEGNLKIANSLLETFARELPISRLQRDLSDSTVSRNFGVAFAHCLIAYESTINGLSSIRLNEKKAKEDLNKDWSILGEAAQTLLRISGEEKAYEIIAKKLKGKSFDAKSWKKLIQSLNIKKGDKQKLLKLTPETYLGYAKRIVEDKK
jgi:adenylosuccinate lyase